MREIQKYLLAALLSSSFLATHSQNAPVTTAPYLSDASPGSVNVEVTVDDFTDIGAFNLTFHYDPTVLSYQGATPNGALNGANFSVSSSEFSPGIYQLVISYPFGYPAVTLSDGSVLATIQFTFTTTTDNHSSLEWYDDDGTSCEYRSSSNAVLNDTPTEDYYIDGVVASQVAPVTYLPVADYYATGSIEIPVTVDNFDQITTLSLTFEYDSTVINYEGTFSSSLSGITVGDQLSSGVVKKIVIGWFDFPALTLADGSEIIRLDFTYNLGSSALSWLDNGIECEYSDANFAVLYDTPTNDYYIDGLVYQKMAPSVFLDTIAGYAGEILAMPAMVKNFVDINSMVLTLDYDPAELSFECATPVPGISDGFTASTNLSDQVVISWTGSSEVTYPDSTVLFYLSFTSTGNSTPLNWYNVGSTCEFTTGPSYTPLNDIPTQDFYTDGLIESGPTTSTWTGGTSTDWNVASNWMSNQVPGSTSDVLITTNNSPANWPEFTGNFILGLDCNNVTMEGTSLFTVTGDLSFETGHLLEITDDGTIKVGGDWINDGMFDPGSGSAEFYGTTSGTISSAVDPGNSLLNYSRETFTVGMTALSGATAGPTGDNAHADVSVGFSFNFLGVDYTQVRINTNGWISFDLSGDDATSGDNSRLFYATAPTTVAAPWWDDLLADGSSSVSYLTEGTAPNRIFSVEWKDVLSYSTGATARLNFQVKLYETSNVIEFCYGTVAGGSYNAAEGASLGIKGSTGGTGDFIEATTGSTVAILTCFESGSGNWPGDNYRFSPPPNKDKEIFWKVLVTKTSPGALQLSRDTDVTGTAP